MLDKASLCYWPAPTQMLGNTWLITKSYCRNCVIIHIFKVTHLLYRYCNVDVDICVLIIPFVIG